MFTVDALKSLNLLEKLKLENGEFIKLTKYLINNCDDEINKLEKELFNSENNQDLIDYSKKKMKLGAFYFMKYIKLNEELTKLIGNKNNKEIILENLNNLIEELIKYKKFFLEINNPKNFDYSIINEEIIYAKNKLKDNLEKELLSLEEELNYVRDLVIETNNFKLFKNLINNKDDNENSKEI
uniref:Uncharacterized protein n=1 Tax=Meloidogyne floridensis TaxID=298350 RepID=A0A915PHB9_9BILA